MLQDLIIIIGIIFFVYKLITHEGKLSLARIVAMLGMSIWLGVGLLHEVVSICIIYLVVKIMMRLKHKSIKNYLKAPYTLGFF